jgi:O-antigen ligase
MSAPATQRAAPGRLERTVMMAAVLLALFPSWRHPTIFFTLSDLLFCIALVLMLRRGLPMAPFGVLTPLWYLSFALFMAALIASSLIRGEPERGLITCIQYIFAYIVLPFLLMAPDAATTVRLIKTFVTAVVLTNVICMVLYYFDYKGEFAFISKDYVTGSGRLSGTLGDPNMNSALIALTCPFVLYLWFSGQLRVWYAAPALAALMTALVMAASVGGLLASSFAVLVFLVASRSLRALLQTLAALAVCGVAVFAWSGGQLPAVFETRVLGAVNSGNLEEAGTFSDRWRLMVEAWAMIDQTLLYGIGPDQFRVVSSDGTPVHNMYLLVWVEGGLPALCGWLGLLATATLSALYVWRATPQHLIGGLGLAVALVFSFVGMSNAHMYGRSWAIPLELALALVVGALAAGRAAPAAAAPAAGYRSELPQVAR